MGFHALTKEEQTNKQTKHKPRTSLSEHGHDPIKPNTHPWIWIENLSLKTSSK